MAKMSDVGSRQDKNVTETDAHGLMCLAAQLALEVRLRYSTRQLLKNQVLRFLLKRTVQIT